ncbi:MAG: carboxypeptidase regulatory-like domain-containing protein [Acidobacteriia bacterium]|nr:carboxypeptidase regulatory-like domain-containing protein [Terriglobia bacterium]
MKRTMGATFTLGFLFLGMIAACGPANAQTFRGTILGTVSDSSGAAIPGAQIVIKNQGTGLTRTAATGDAGTYQVPELPVGQYSVTVSKEGFESATMGDLGVTVAGERRADFTLQPGRIESRVEVQATVPMVATTEDILGGTVQATQVANLPVNGRDYTKLIFMTPGATGSPDQMTDSPGSFGEISVNGARGRANNFLLDGTDMNDGYRNDPTINQAGVFGTPATILPVDAIAELAVLSNFAPEYGRNAGAVINIVTKSGTNTLHGTVAEYFRNAATDARNFFNDVQPGGSLPPKNAFHNSQYGVSLGGPIIRDKTFFFVDYDGQRETGALASQACVPSAGDMQAAITAIGGSGLINPVIAGILKNNPWPAPSVSDTNCPNVTTSNPFRNRIDSFIGKIDHSFNEKNLLTGRYYFGDSDQDFPLSLVNGGALPGFNTLTPTRINLVSLSYVRVPSSTQVNEVRFGYNRFYETFFPQDKSFDPASVGLNTGVGSQDFGLPLMRFTGLASLGSNLSLPRGRTDQNWQFIDNFSWKLGRHQLKLGYEFRRTPVTQFFDAGYRGRIDFRYGDAQTSLEQFLLGIPSGGRAAEGDSRRNTAQNSHAGYAQDSFRISRKLTFNYGVRWDYFGVIHEQNNLFSNFDAVNGLRMVGTNGLSSLYNRDLNNFAPRVSVAYDLTGKGKSVVRAGWGVFYDLFSQDFFLGQLPFNTFNPGPAYNGAGAKPVLFSFGVATDAEGNNLPLSANQPVFPQSTFAATDVFAVDRNIRTPYMENYNLNVQQQLANGVVLQVGYVGSEGHKLFRYRDINQPTQAMINSHDPQATGGCCAPRPFDNGPFPPSPPSPEGTTFFYVNNFESSANSNYNSLQTQLRITNLKGFQTTINYTYSHSIDNASDGQDFVANASQPNNSYRPDLERGNSNFDVRHRFVWMWSYNFPTRQGSLARLTNGWGFNSVITLQAGQPFHLNFFDDYDGTGEFFPRPDVVGNPFAGTHTPDSFINLSAFHVPCTLNTAGDGFADACIQGTQHQGNMGRNSLIGPHYRQFDFSVFKDTQITERLKVQFRAEFYNLPNHPNFASPLYPGFSAAADNNGVDPVSGLGMGFFPLTQTGDVGVGDPFLGGGGPRGIQFALKFTF